MAPVCVIEFSGIDKQPTKDPIQAKPYDRRERSAETAATATGTACSTATGGLIANALTRCIWAVYEKGVPT